jgi:G3E family GTPase
MSANSASVTRVYLITGFLGSGKTTFLNRIIDRFPKDRKLTILMNEFGEIGIDGTLVEGDDIDMMEISRGSIFCVCVKTDFIKGLYELVTKIKPDALIIESTGVANPSDLKRDIQLPIFQQRFHFQEQFCTIDAGHFLDAYQAYASLEKQIASSTVFIINKTDLAPADDIAEIKQVIYESHSDPVCYETTYSNIPFEKYFPELVSSDCSTDTPVDGGISVLTDAELDAFVEELLNDPNLEITPPDLLVSAAFTWNGSNLDEVREMARNLPANVIRSKGFVGENGVWYLFSYVMGTWSIEKTHVPEHRIKSKNTLVFIGPPDIMPGIGDTMKTGHWISRGVFQPFSGMNK